MTAHAGLMALIRLGIFRMQLLGLLIFAVVVVGSCARYEPQLLPRVVTPQISGPLKPKSTGALLSVN